MDYNENMNKKSFDVEELEKLKDMYISEGKKILSKFGPEGAYEISAILLLLADEDIQNGMIEGL